MTNINQINNFYIPQKNNIKTGQSATQPQISEVASKKIKEFHTNFDKLCLSTQKKIISLDEVKSLFPNGCLEENYVTDSIKKILLKLKTDRNIINLTPELSEKDYKIIQNFMNKANGRFIDEWKGNSNTDTIPNIQKLALFARTMQLTNQTNEFIEFDMNKWDIIVDGIIRKPKEAIIPLLEYKVNSYEINTALSDFSKMTPEIQNKVNMISQYLDSYIVKKEFTVFRGDKSFNILPIINIDGEYYNLANVLENVSKTYQELYKNNSLKTNQIEDFVRTFLKDRQIPQSRFMSTAMTESAIKDYAKKIKWEITVPVGTRGTSIESFNIERLNEAEFLAQRNGQLKIKNATYNPQEELWYFYAIIEQEH